MNISVELAQIAGPVLHVPASKSMSQRALAAALLHPGQTIIRGYGHSEDEQAALRIIRQLGADVEQSDDTLEVQSSGRPQSREGFIDCGESGLSARLFSPIAALSGLETEIRGHGSLLLRPMAILTTVLPLLGIRVLSPGHYLPLRLQGPLVPADISIDGSASSQYISGLLFALTSAARQPVTMRIEQLSSKAYLDLSTEVLAAFGKPVLQQGYERILIDPAAFHIKDPVHFNIEGDWSSAAFWIAAGAISGSVCLSGLRADSRQPDSALQHIVARCGASVSWNGDLLQVRSGALQAFHYDATDSPDLFPVLAVLAGCCNGESSIRGLHRLYHKESDRARTICQLLAELGVSYSLGTDTLYITGAAAFQPINTDSSRDHRMVMAAALAALRTPGPVQISRAAAVRKSYPGFFEDLARMGARISTFA